MSLPTIKTTIHSEFDLIRNRNCRVDRPIQIELSHRCSSSHPPENQILHTSNAGFFEGPIPCRHQFLAEIGQSVISPNG